MRKLQKSLSLNGGQERNRTWSLESITIVECDQRDSCLLLRVATFDRNLDDSRGVKLERWRVNTHVVLRFDCKMFAILAHRLVLSTHGYWV